MFGWIHKITANGRVYNGFFVMGLYYGLSNIDEYCKYTFISISRSLIPSWERSHILSKRNFEDDFPFPMVGYVIVPWRVVGVFFPSKSFMCARV